MILETLDNQVQVFQMAHCVGCKKHPQVQYKYCSPSWMHACIKREFRKSEWFFPSEVEAFNLIFVIIVEFRNSNLLSCLNLRRRKTSSLLTVFFCRGTNVSVRGSQLLPITTVDSICQGIQKCHTYLTTAYPFPVLEAQLWCIKLCIRKF